MLLDDDEDDGDLCVAASGRLTVMVSGTRDGKDVCVETVADATIRMVLVVNEVTEHFYKVEP